MECWLATPAYRKRCIFPRSSAARTGTNGESTGDTDLSPTPEARVSASDHKGERISELAGLLPVGALLPVPPLVPGSGRDEVESNAARAKTATLNVAW